MAHAIPPPSEWGVTTVTSEASPQTDKEPGVCVLTTDFTGFHKIIYSYIFRVNLV
jgi:hypothetical protein